MCKPLLQLFRISATKVSVSSVSPPKLDIQTGLMARNFTDFCHVMQEQYLYLWGHIHTSGTLIGGGRCESGSSSYPSELIVNVWENRCAMPTHFYEHLIILEPIQMVSKHPTEVL